MNTPSPPQTREIRLLARHWEWLASQPRSASATLRYLVEHARRDANGHFAAESAKEACYFFMRDKAGDRPHFEEACRALFAGDAVQFAAQVAGWPEEIRCQAQQLAASAWPHNASERQARHG